MRDPRTNHQDHKKSAEQQDLPHHAAVVLGHRILGTDDLVPLARVRDKMFVFSIFIAFMHHKSIALEATNCITNLCHAEDPGKIECMDAYASSSSSTSTISTFAVDSLPPLGGADSLPPPLRPLPVPHRPVRTRDDTVRRRS